MKRKALALLAVCAALLSVAPVCSATQGTCADWEGTWVFTYDGDATETIIITDICSKPTPSSPTPACMPEGSVKNAWLCIAKGKKQSDNQTVQIRQISMDTSVYGYYEATDAEMQEQGANAPYDKIFGAGFTNCTFTADEANYGLKSGLKSGCTPATTTTTTVEPTGPCPAQKVLGEDNPDLENLRDFRDGPLAQSYMGRSITRIYYNNAASINAVLDRSPALRAVARQIFEAAVQLGGNKK